MATTTKLYAANNTWVCPPGVTSVNGNAYAGGGAGAGGGVNPTTGGGGGGGGAARNNTTARAGGVGRIGYVQLSYTTPLASALTDNFDDNSIDTAKWYTYTNGTGTVAESGQKIVITPQASLANAIGLLVSFGDTSSPFDLTGSYFFVNAKQVLNASDSTSTELDVQLDGSNYGGII
jgi:hypothetical protein